MSALFGYLRGAAVALSLVVTSSACEHPAPPKPPELTKLQREFMTSATVPLANRVYMEACLNRFRDGDWEYCLRQMPQGARCTSGGPSVLETAAGTAIGIGAAKVLSGK